MKTKHTPGPWSNLNGIIGNDKLYKMIAIVTVGKQNNIDRKEANANEKLITVAPELLKRLKYLIDACEDARQSGRQDFIDDQIKESKELIKKIIE